MHDELLASKPEGASHNSDICQFCVEKATEDMPTVPDPSRSGGPDDSTINRPDENGGRDNHPMSDTSSETMISQKAHEALLAKAVADATSTTERALETKTTEASTATAEAEATKQENATLKSENERLNEELDKAQVSLKAAEEKVQTLEKDIEEKDAAAARTEVANKRAEQVKNLKLYDDDYVAERASSWAELSDEDWASRLDEWSKLKPANTETTGDADKASSMTGSTEKLTKDAPADKASETKVSTRRAALGLVANS